MNHAILISNLRIWQIKALWACKTHYQLDMHFQVKCSGLLNRKARKSQKSSLIFEMNAPLWSYSNQQVSISSTFIAFSHTTNCPWLSSPLVSFACFWTLFKWIQSCSIYYGIWLLLLNTVLIKFICVSLCNTCWFIPIVVWYYNLLNVGFSFFVRNMLL